MMVSLARRLLVTLVLLLAAAGPLRAQIGISGFYNANDASFTDEALPGEFPYGNGGEVALNYWFRLRKYRIEFQPTVYAARAGEQFGEYGFQFKTNIYLFDLGTDCDCPTFGKQGPQLEKGFFLQLSPGVAYHRRHTTDLDGGGDLSDWSPSVGAAVGIDFGLSNLVTVSPIVGLRHTLFPLQTEVFVPADGGAGPLPGQEFRLTTYQVGLQLTLRLDKRRY